MFPLFNIYRQSIGPTTGKPEVNLRILLLSKARDSESWGEPRTPPPHPITWRGRRTERTRGPCRLLGRRGELDHLRLPTRETEAGLHGESSCGVPGGLATTDPHPARPSRHPPSPPAGAAGLRKCVWARPGPGARGRRLRGRRAVAPPGPGRLESARPVRPAPPPPPQVSAARLASRARRPAWGPGCRLRPLRVEPLGPRPSGARSRRRPRALARLALAQRLPSARGDPSLTARPLPAALRPRAALGVGGRGAGPQERNPETSPGTVLGRRWVAEARNKSRKTHQDVYGPAQPLQQPASCNLEQAGGERACASDCECVFGEGTARSLSVTRGRPGDATGPNSPSPSSNSQARRESRL